MAISDNSGLYSQDLLKHLQSKYTEANGNKELPEVTAFVEYAREWLRAHRPQRLSQAEQNVVLYFGDTLYLPLCPKLAEPSDIVQDVAFAI